MKCEDCGKKKAPYYCEKCGKQLCKLCYYAGYCYACYIQKQKDNYKKLMKE